MSERRARLECPVCPGARLTARRVTPTSGFEFDHCGRCGGIWFDQGETAKLRRHRPAALWAAITRRPRVHTLPCRSCDARIGRHADECRACGWRVELDCPVCDRPMVRDRGSGVKLDGCRTCRGAWFDNAELEGIWKAQAALAVAPVTLHAERNQGSWDLPLDGVADLARVAGEGGRALAEGSAQVAGSLPEVAAGAFEGVATAGEALFNVLAAILEGLFGALGGL
jgi:Zn-finger nucleic acid-binding protein